MRFMYWSPMLESVVITAPSEVTLTWAQATGTDCNLILSLVFSMGFFSRTFVEQQHKKLDNIDNDMQHK